MRFEDFNAEIAPLETEWDAWFLDPDSLDSFLAFQSGSANPIMLNSVASVGMSSWVDVQRNLGQNVAFGVQVTGGVADAFASAGANQWNIGQGGVVSGIFGGAQGQQALQDALGAFSGQGVDANALAGALGKAALGIALGVVSAALPVVGAVAGLIAGAVTLIVREYRRAEEDHFAVPQNYLPDSGATAATCSSGSANAADQMMMRLIRDQIPAFSAVTGTRGIPSTTDQVETAAELTELTKVFLPDAIPTGGTAPDLRWVEEMKDPERVPGVTKHPRAPGDLYYPSPEKLRDPKIGELYAVQDSCPDTNRAFIRIGIFRDFGTLGTGWIPGRGEFSGPAYWVGQVGQQRGSAAGGPGKDSGGRDLPWPHDGIGLEPNVRPVSGDGIVSAAQMFPASSAFMAGLERQVMSAPGCFVVSPLEILMYWRQWQSGFQELAERFVWEGGQLPLSFNRNLWTTDGPTSYLCTPHGPQTCHGGPGPAEGLPSLGQNTMLLGGQDVAQLNPASFFSQAAAWKVKRGGRWVVESSVALPQKAIEYEEEGLDWQDGNPLANYKTLSGSPIRWSREMVIPDRIYSFRDIGGLIADKGSTGYYGPVVDLIVEPWANSIESMQRWALKTLQVAYITQSSPAIVKDSMLRGELKARREQLLTHDARFKIKIPDVLDNVGPDSYLEALKAAGVGKMGAGSLASSAEASASGADLDPGADMPIPDIPVPIPPGFVSTPSSPRIPTALLGAGALALGLAFFSKR